MLCGDLMAFGSWGLEVIMNLGTAYVSAALTGEVSLS